MFSLSLIIVFVSKQSVFCQLLVLIKFQFLFKLRTIRESSYQSNNNQIIKKTNFWKGVGISVLLFYMNVAQCVLHVRSFVVGIDKTSYFDIIWISLKSIKLSSPLAPPINAAVVAKMLQAHKRKRLSQLTNVVMICQSFHTYINHPLYTLRLNICLA